MYICKVQNIECEDSRTWTFTFIYLQFIIFILEQHRALHMQAKTFVDAGPWPIPYHLLKQTQF